MARSLLMRASLLLFGVASMVGCDQITSLSRHGPVGGYTAIILYSTATADPTIQAPNSGTFTINLAEDQSTSGHLHLVAFNGNPAVDADMAGTWAANGDAIVFTQTADTFVRTMTFTIERISDRLWYLVGDDVFAGTRINVRLAQNS